MRLWKEAVAAAALSCAALLTAIPGEAHDFTLGKIVIADPWARQSPGSGGTMAGFLTIRNGGAADRLVKATAEIAPTVRLHEMKMAGDVMQMAELKDGIAVPTGATVELKPKSLHVMFEGLTAKPAVGATFKGTLTFEKAGTVTIEYEVKAANAGMN